MNYDNAAARLHSLLKAAKEIPADRPCAAAWRALLETKDPVLLLERQALMMALVPQAVAQLQEAYPGSADSWIHWSSQIFAAFGNSNLQGQWQTFLQHIDSNTMMLLDLSAHLLDSKTKANKLNLEEINTHRNGLNDLLAEVLESSYPDELKQYLARSLRRIISTLDEYKISGGQAVLDAVDAAVGRAMLDESLGRQVQNSPLAGRVFTAIAAIANTVTVATGATALAGPALKLLGA